jgi:thiamine-phosphate pyrophosphorylase
VFEIIAVTDSRLCAGDFWERLDAMAAAGVSAILLREKALSPAAYAAFFARAHEICARHGTPLIAHGLAGLSCGRGADRAGLHLPFADFATLAARADGDALLPGVRVGVSVHSADEALRAASLRAAYVLAGHIFQTESKAARAPRGLRFLSELCERLPIPVYAIGGISEANIAQIRQTGAAGACLMSSFMSCADPAAHLKSLQDNLL